MLSGKETDTVYMRGLPFFAPTFAKRVTSLCKWSGCRLGNKSLVMYVFCLLICRFCFGYFITIIWESY